MIRRSVGAVALVAGCVSISATAVSPASPEAISLGRQLFEKNWTPQNPALRGSDGLGPLFNGQSCAACHRQGGIGGAGEAEFNAKTISIGSMRVTGGPITPDVIRQSVRGFHPGFIDPIAGVVNSLSLTHHGGTPAFAEARRIMMAKIPAVFSDNGGSANAAEVRRANATPISYSSVSGNYKTIIHARMFQRNTPTLFGAGLIDQVTDKQLRAVQREQSSHPEISGRMATLAGGGIGKFGWRGNVETLLDFCDQACAAEVGLETRRIDQPADPMAPSYRNPSHDISDAQIKSMTAFVAALPAPTRAIPTDSERRMMAGRGEQLFASIGCSHCHRPTLGPATGIYSDLLLHDMGTESYDLNPADPYIVRMTPMTRMNYETDATTTATFTMGDETIMGTRYYGGKYMMEAGTTYTTTTRRTSGRSRSASRVAMPSSPTRSSVKITREGYWFDAAPVPPMTLRFVNQRSNSRSWQTGKEEKSDVVEVKLNRRNRERTASGNDSYSYQLDSTTVETMRETRTDYTRLHMEPTYFTQEWRTPPLWGVHDSAPYMHDGRAETLLEAITQHEGESEGTRDRFLALPLQDRQAVVEFLHTLVASPNAPQPKS